MWGLQHTGPVTPENEYYIVSVFLWFIAAVSALRLVVLIVALPFRRRQ